ncbi:MULTISPECIES: pentapeptide repeat-containing protein [Aphanizomenon]|uniref:Pentapeptide repeat-containing protein n=1 Tax=Aphanizomenon flos-aquae FACHB-1249 TaxID=2692889 RepID=A0ABR8IQ30_APHFL|nr:MULTISPECIES: pentapeptide repeat-containing protein [Aphanizomenon]MBD2631435.1 pentapeptide repeat-containing protein [Aphanizomenon sp. FACHB-1399]MBD2642531.1 pentapeptide repeat-containing protein [Aphanizomenon sp. FACHB-1401]MBD2685427.1 pentapeptide repeat-containing protein [Aphanizomenon flos-aquae FACHB-1249]
MSTDKSKQQNSSQVDKHLHLQEISEVKELREKFLIIAEISDPLTREYQFALLEKEAEKAGLSAETYRRLYETYLPNKEHIPQYPQKPWVFKEWLRYFLEFPKKQLAKKVLIIIVEKGLLISLISGVLKYYWEAPQRQKQKEFQAWTIINNAAGKEVSGGRISALQDLNENGVELWNLVLDRANLSGIKLENGKLAQTSFKRAILECTQEKCSNLRKANLYQSNFYDASLSKIDFRETNLIDANLQKAYLEQAKFQKAHLYKANLKESKIKGANFQGADLEDTKFKDAIMCGDVFDQATSYEKYICANFIEAKNLTAEQVKSAKNWEKACYDPELRIKLNLPPENPDYCQN